MNTLTAYIKPTNYCTIDCDHCYLPLESRQNKNIISTEKLRKTFFLLKDLKEKESKDKISIIWHGGEPMMLKPEWYENAHKIADEILGESEYEASMQTSLIPYNKRWNRLIHERLDSFVGISIDFSTRKFNNSNERYIDTLLKRVSELNSNGINCTPSFVPSKNEIKNGKEIVNFFKQNKFKYFNFERYSNFENKKDINFPSNIEHSKFMIDIFDEIMRLEENGINSPIATPIVCAINGVENGISGDRWGTTCQKSFVVIEPNGNINTCPDRALVEKPFSNIDDGADRLIKSKARRIWIRTSNLDHKGSHCSTCEYRNWCKSGCPINPNDPQGRFHQECSGHKLFLNHVKNYLNSYKKNIALNYLKRS